MKSHLDLGSGDKPRNPFRCDRIFGTDQSETYASENIVICNLGFEKIPFPDHSFDSVSAFDLLEHIPRYTSVPSQGGSTFPFIFLMSEILRVLKPGGLLLAVTPAYPAKQAFQDPTHVNFITEDTHSYFCDEKGKYLSRYGFTGAFKKESVEWVLPEEIYSEKISLRLKIKKLKRKILGAGLSHLKWELRAIK